MKLFERPHPENVAKLKSCRLYETANPLDKLWDSPVRDFNLHAFYPNQDDREVIVEYNSLIYLPRYPKDWLKHPLRMRGLEMIHYNITSRGGLTIQDLGQGKTFFLVSKSWKKAILSGEAKHQDLYAALADKNPIFQH